MHRTVKKISLIALIAGLLLFLNQSHSHEQGNSSVQVQITTDPWKSLVVCASDVQVIEGAVLLPAENESPGLPVSKAVFTTDFRALLQFSSPHPCTKEQTRHHPYQAKKIIYSEWPFLAEFVPAGTKKKKFRPPASAEGGWLFPFIPANQISLSGSGGGTFGPDDDHQHKRPYGFFPETSGDIDLSLLGGFQLPRIMGDYLPDHTTWQAVWLGNEQSHTLWVYPGDQPEALTSIQVSSSEMVELVSGSESDEKKLAWLRQKLRPDQRETLLQQLLALQDIYSAGDAILSEPVLELIRNRLVEVFDKTRAEIDLEFECFRLHRDLEELAGKITESLVLAHRPDTETVYEGGEVEKLMHQAGGVNSKSGQVEGGGAQGNAGGNGGNQQQRRGNQDAPGQADNNAGNNGGLQGQNPEQDVPETPPKLTITFVGAVNTGKSALANRLIGFPYFHVSENPVASESDYYFRGLRIRSLPGFLEKDNRTYIQDNGIGRDDIIVFVLDSDLTDGVIAGMATALKNNGNKIIFVKNQIVRVVGDPHAARRDYRERFVKKIREIGISAAPLIFTRANLLAVDRAEATDELEDHLCVFLTSSLFRWPAARVTTTIGLSDYIHSFLAGERLQVFLEFQKTRLRVLHGLSGKLITEGVLDRMKRNLENPDAPGDRGFFIRAVKKAIMNSHSFLTYYNVSVRLNENQRTLLESVMENIDRVFRGGVGEAGEVSKEEAEFYLTTCSSAVLKMHQGYLKSYITAVSTAGANVFGGIASMLFSLWNNSLGAMFGGFLGGGAVYGVNHMHRNTATDLAKCFWQQKNLVERRIEENRKRNKTQLNDRGLSENELLRKESEIDLLADIRLDNFSEWADLIDESIKKAEQSLREFIDSILTELQEQLDRGRVVTFAGYSSQIPIAPQPTQTPLTSTPDQGLAEQSSSQRAAPSRYAPSPPNVPPPPPPQASVTQEHVYQSLIRVNRAATGAPRYESWLGEAPPDRGKATLPNPEARLTNKPLIQLDGDNPFSWAGRLGLRMASSAFDAVFRTMETADNFDYAPLPVFHPQRTRRHRFWVAEDLMGGHLSNDGIFDRFIGDMADPVIVCVNGFSDTYLHAFLLFWNSKKHEYNTLHIRQGSYYPEFMDKEQTLSYFSKNKKRVVAALSLTQLVRLYEGASLDLKVLRVIFQARMTIKEIRYSCQSQNCMTFSMLAFKATNLDLDSFLERTGLGSLQSPLHIIQALAQSEKNHLALHVPEHPNPDVAPRWLMEINQPAASAGTTRVPR